VRKTDVYASKVTEYVCSAFQAVFLFFADFPEAKPLAGLDIRLLEVPPAGRMIELL